MDTDKDLAPSQVIINGQEYTPDEAQALIDKGRMATEYESKWNTPLDKVWPEYGRLTQTQKQLEQDLQAARAEVTAFKEKQEHGTDTPADAKDAREAAQKLGIVLNTDLEKAGYIKREDLDKYYEEKDSQRKAVEGVHKEADRLETELNGDDGRPKFNKRVAIAYASAYGKDSLMDAYNEMHEDALKTWQSQQVDSKKKPDLKTLKGTQANKQPADVRPNNDNVKQLLREKLWGAEE